VKWNGTIALLPDRYLRRIPTVATHIQMIESVKADGFACRWTPQNHSSGELTVAARDRTVSLCDLTGTLAANGLEIWC
jgi:hypothetical protein